MPFTVTTFHHPQYQTSSGQFMKPLTIGICGAAMLAATTHAFANLPHRFKVMTDLPSNVLVEQHTFGHNADLGRAWVEIAFREPFFDEYPAQLLRVAIDGLAYDRAGGNIVLRQAGGETVCATIRERGWGIFQYQVVTPTDACRLSLIEQTVTRDDGFNVWSVPRWALTLDLPRDL